MSSMPNTLRMMNVFLNGISFIGQVLELKLPKIAMKTQDWEGGGLLAPVKLLKGLEAIEIEHTYSAPIREIFADFGIEKHDASMLRFMGSYSEEGTGNDLAVEIVVRGRHNELDPGDAKTGDNGNWKYKTDATYYKLTVQGEVWLEIDTVNMIFVVMGVDRLASHRKNIGI